MARKKPAAGHLSELEIRFVAELVDNGGNATLAYHTVRPGTKYGSARTLGARLLAKVHVKQAYRREIGRRLRRRGDNADRVLGEWEVLAYSSISQVIDPRTFQVRDDIAPSAWRAIAQLEVTPVKIGRRIVNKVKVRMHAKGEALDRIGRHLGLYKELPPLEHVLALLPSSVAEALRQEIAKSVPEALAGPGGGPPPADPGTDGDDDIPDWAKPALGAGGGDGHPGGPELPVPGDEVDGRPVAGELPAEPGEADPDALLPPGGQIGDERGPDPGPLFDDA